MTIFLAPGAHRVILNNTVIRLPNWLARKVVTLAAWLAIVKEMEKSHV